MSRRFNISMLEQSEYVFRDYNIVLEQFSVAAPDTISHPVPVDGALLLCSKSLIFDPRDQSIPMYKFSFDNKFEALNEGGPNIMIVKVSQLIRMEPLRPNKITASETVATFTMRGVPVKQFLQVINEMVSTQRLPPTEAAARLKAITTDHERALIDKGIDYQASGMQESELVRTRGSLVSDLLKQPGQAAVTDTAFYFKPFYDVACIPQTRVLLGTITGLILRRHNFKQVGLEIRTCDGKAILLAFESFQDRESIYSTLTVLTESQLTPELDQDPTWLWVNGKMSNLDYLKYLNDRADRTPYDLAQYPVFPWVVADYTSKTLDLTKPATFRDLSKPVGALNPERLDYFKDRYNQMPENEPRFLYGTHYSTPAFVLYYLVRQRPQQMLQLQAGNFDAADRLFLSLGRTYESVLTNPTDVKELIPEFYEGDGSFLLLPPGLELGKLQDGTEVGDVELPPWAKDPQDFVTQCRAALESDYVSARLHLWIDLVFGFKQRGEEAVAADNLFYHLTYDTALDEQLTSDLPADARNAISSQMKEFGQTPRQLFHNPHPPRAVMSSGEAVLPSRVYTCGVGKQGQLGLGSSQEHTIPKCVESLTQHGVIQVACGGSEFDTGYSACLVHTGDVYTWGSGAYGKLGHGDNQSIKVPKQVMRLQGQLISQIACGSGHMGGLTASGKLYTWGWGMQGQLGHGSNQNASLPMAVKSLGGVCGKQLACGEAHTVMCTASGDLFTWGWGEKGQLGHNDLASLNNPKLLKELQGTKVSQVACGLAHTSVVTSTHEVYTFGWDQYGQLGLGSFSFGNVKQRPQLVTAVGKEPMTQVACGGSYTFSKTRGGQLYSFGWGKDGQLGLGWRTDRSNPAQVGREMQEPVRHVACCGSHVVACTIDGKAYSWGNGEQGKLGHSPGTNVSSPMLIDALKDQQAVQADCTGGITDGHSIFLVHPRYAVAGGPSGAPGSDVPPVADMGELHELLGLDEESVAEAVDVTSALEQTKGIYTGSAKDAASGIGEGVKDSGGIVGGLLKKEPLALDRTSSGSTAWKTESAKKADDPHSGDIEVVAGLYERLATVAQTTEAAIVAADQELLDVETRSVVANQLVLEFNRKAHKLEGQPDDLVSPSEVRDLGQMMGGEMAQMMGTAETLDRQKQQLQLERQGAIDECQRQVQSVVREAMTLQDKKLSMRDNYGQASRPILTREFARLNVDVEAVAAQLSSIGGQLESLSEQRAQKEQAGRDACSELSDQQAAADAEVAQAQGKLEELQGMLQAQQEVVTQLKEKATEASAAREARYKQATDEALKTIDAERAGLETQCDRLKERETSLLKERHETGHQLTMLEMQEERCGFLITALGNLVDEGTSTIDGIAALASRSGGGEIFGWKQRVRSLEVEQEKELSALRDNSEQCSEALQGVQGSLQQKKASAESLKASVAKADAEVPALEQQKKDAVAGRDFKAATRLSQEIKVLTAARQEQQETLDGILREASTLTTPTVLT